MPSLDDTLRSFKASMPHAKIAHMEVLDPAKQAAKQADPKWNRKLADEKKRSLDELGHLSRTTDRTRQYLGRHPGTKDAIRLVDAPTPTGRPWALRTYKTTDDRYEVRWVDSGNVPDKISYQRDITARLVDEKPSVVVKREGLTVQAKPQIHDFESSGRGFNARKSKLNGAKMSNASGEVISESMVPPPERGVDHIADRWRKDGRLQVRMMGKVPQEVCVFKSRKHMESSMKEFNRDSPDIKFRNKWGGEKAKGANSGRYD